MKYKRSYIIIFLLIMGTLLLLIGDVLRSRSASILVTYPCSDVIKYFQYICEAELLNREVFILHGLAIINPKADYYISVESNNYNRLDITVSEKGGPDLIYEFHIFCID